jgi:hypothetical protein
MTTEVNEQVRVFAENVPVLFSAALGEVAVRGPPFVAFQSIGVKDAQLRIGPIQIEGSYQSQPPGPSGESITRVTDVALIFRSGIEDTDPELFRLEAASVTYKAFPAGVTIGGVSYPNGAQQVIVEDGNIKIGDTVELYGSFSIIRAAGGDDNTPIYVTFQNTGILIKVDSKEVLNIAASGKFRFGGPEGFVMDGPLTVTGFDILPSRQPNNLVNAADVPDAIALSTPAPAKPTRPTTLNLGPITLTNPGVAIEDFGVKFGKDQYAGQIGLALRIGIGVETASISTAGGTGLVITDGPDADSFGISGSFDMDVYLDPGSSFAPSGVQLGNFDLKIDSAKFSLGKFLTITADNLKFDPGAEDNEDMLYFGKVDATINAGPLSIGGGASDFAILGNGDMRTGPKFGIRVSVGASENGSGMGLPSWLPLKNLTVGIQWKDFNNKPGDFTLIIDAQLAGISGLSGASFSGGVKGLEIDLGLLAEGEFPIIGIQGFNIGVEATIGGVGVKGTLVAGIVKFDAGLNLIPATDTTTAVAKRVFYVGLRGAISIPGVGGLDLSVAFSDFGPLSMSISADIPIILDPISGLTITDIRGGIDFGATIPDPLKYNGQEVDARASAFELRKLSSLTNPSANGSWQDRIISQISNIVKNSGDGDLAFDDMVNNMVIRIGATLYSSYTSKTAFRIEGDIAIDVTGKILIVP